MENGPEKTLGFTACSIHAFCNIWWVIKCIYCLTWKDKSHERTVVDTASAWFKQLSKPGTNSPKILMHRPNSWTWLICYNAHTCCRCVCACVCGVVERKAPMDRLQRTQGDIVADLLKVTGGVVCQVWHRITQQGSDPYAMYRGLNQHDGEWACDC